MLESLSSQQQENFETFAAMLLEANKKMNLTRITDASEIRSRHFEDSLVIIDRLWQLEQQIGSNPSLVDIGSGAGFPALALAIALPNWHISSVEATGKKADFQSLVIKELQLDNVAVVNARAEDIAHQPQFRERFDAALTRAIGSLAMTAELSVPLLKVGGIFLAWKGPKVEQEIEKGQKMLIELGCSKLKQWNYSLPDIDADYRIIEAAKIKPTPSKYPREFKFIKKDA